MLWLRAILRKFAAAFCAALIVGPFITACGFTPVYHQNSQSQTRDYLSLIEVASIGGKRGMQLRNWLKTRISPAGSEQAPRYLLSIDLNSSTEAVLIQLNNTATRQNLKISAAFTLMNISTGMPVYTGKAVSVGSYNVVESEFATIAAENNAAKRVAREIGEEILDLLVVFFSRSGS